MKYINKHQLFSLMFIFEIGSTTLFALGIKAKQDAWVAVLIAMAIGLGFAWIYTELQNLFPQKNYIEIIISILGKWLGIPLSLLYAVYWLWPTVRNLREFGELVLLTVLPNTPLTVIVFTFVTTSLYVLSLGIRVLGRTSEVIMPLITFFIISLFILVFLSEILDIKNIQPILGDGIKPILKVSYPNISIFPFGEIFIFSMYWCYVDDKYIIRKTTFLVLASSGILLSLTLAIYVCTLGVESTSILTVPFIEVVKMVNVGEFFTNLDAIVICVIFLGGFYKMSIYLKGVAMVLATVFNIKHDNTLLPILSFIVFWIAIIFEPNYTYHKWMTPFDTNYFYTAYLQVIPTILLVIHWTKSKIHKCPKAK